MPDPPNRDWKAGTPKSLQWMVRRYPDVFAVTDQASLFREVHHYLREAWREPDPARRLWWLFEARRHHESVRLGIHGHAPMIPLPPEDTQFDRALVCVQIHLASKMKVCKNPACAAPYFFRRGRAQTHCSTDCGNASRDAAKLRWEQKNRPPVRNDPK